MDIVQRFLNYTKINTTTNRAAGAAGIMPSNPKELELAGLIKGELEALGIKNISLSEKSILIAKIPSNLDAPAASIAFFAHLDTSAEQTNDTKAQIVRYEGGDICLNKELDIYLKESENEELQDYKGDEIIVTDGTSLLGADDKAAIAAIVNALEFFVQNPQIKHGEIIACFVPDEEQGLRGAKTLDVSEIGADFGYCLDCCGIGEFIYENWNAGDCVVTFKGQSAHPMNAKGKLVNSLLLAHKFISLLPAGEALAASGRRFDLRRLDVGAALRALLPWPEASGLDELAPQRIEVPSGSRIRVSYVGEQGEALQRPVLAVRVQECFGWADTPRVADDRVPVLIHLLSPAGRPVAVTDDLRSFWTGPYRQVRAEMRGRYPRHAWPENPLSAPATRGARRRG